MNKPLERIDIDIPNNWLNSGYYVYIAKIGFEGKTYFYIGQTGDNHHPTARGPLYRISGHISKLGSSAQNQVIKGLRKELNIDVDDREGLEKVLSEINFTYTFWKISDFAYKDPEITKRRKRKETQFVEHLLIYKLQNKNSLFNSKVRSRISKSNQSFFQPNEINDLQSYSNKILKSLEDEF